MSEIASLYAKIGADVSGLEKGLGKARSDLEKMGKEFANGMAGAVGLQLSFAGLAAGAVGLVGEMAHLGMQFQQTEMAFSTLLGSGEEATAFLDQLRDFAAATPFQFSDLTDASRRLLAFGFAADQVVPMLTNIGDAVAAMGGNAQMVDRVTLALGQMQAKSKVAGGEMLQLTEAGIPAWRYLAESMGLTTGEVMKLSEKGLIPARQAIDAILEGMQGDFGGMMAVQAQTAGGAVSNLQDTLERVGTEIGGNFVPAIERAAPAIGQFVEALGEGIQAGFTLNKTYALVAIMALKSAGAITADTAAMRAEAVASGDLMAGLLGVAGEAEHAAQAHAEQMNAVVGAADSYRAYIEQAAGITEAERAHFLALLDSGAAVTEKGDSIAYLAETSGLLTEAQYDELRATQEAAEAQRESDNAVRALEASTARWAGLAAEAAAATSGWKGVLLDTKGAMDLLKESVGGAVGNENRQFADQQSDLAGEIAKVQSELSKYQGMTGQTVTVQREATNSQAEYELALLNAGHASDALAEAQKNLAENTDPEKQAALAEAALRAQVALEKAQEKAGEMGKGVGGEDTFTADYSTKIDETKTKLDELKAKYAENAAAHEEATKRIWFGYLMQEAAVDGFSETEQIALAATAQSWGLLDSDTQTAQLSMIGAMQKLNEDGNIEAYMDAVNDAKDRVLGLGDAINTLPKETNLSINVATNGYVPNIPGTGGSPQAPIPLAEGFQGMVTSPTLFLVGESGPEFMNVVPQGDMGTGGAGFDATWSPPMTSGGSGGGNVVWNGDVVVNGAGDPAEAAREVIRVLQDRGLLTRTATR